MAPSAHAIYETLLVDLHREMRAQRSEGPRAEDLRRQMVAPWYALTEEEQALFDDLSEDLYVLEGKRIALPLDKNETLDDVRMRLRSALLDGQCQLLLSLLRKLPTLNADDFYLMARCWRNAGFTQACFCFYDYADEIKSTDVLKNAERLLRIPPVLVSGDSPPIRPKRRIPTERASASTAFPQFSPMHGIEGP